MRKKVEEWATRKKGIPETLVRGVMSRYKDKSESWNIFI